MMIIGLTGGIGMGKSTVAKYLRQIGFPVFSADDAVNALLKKGGAGVVPVATFFPETLKRGGIDHKLLGRAVFDQPKKLDKLEEIIHPLVIKAEKAFLQKTRKTKARAAILEIPLLFETGAEKRCNITLCVTASAIVQKARVLSRKNMDRKKLQGIMARQMPDAEKCRRADYVVPTGTDMTTTKKCLRKLFYKLGLIEK
jgi:dephospho-CoA kinase